MIQRKLVIGRYVKLDLAGVNPKVEFEDGAMFTQPARLMTIAQSTGFFSKRRTSGVGQGTGAKDHRNFQWLGWYKGAVSQASLGNTDVLTGPMSGCWITVHDFGGKVHVGHVGTYETPAHPKSVAAKKAWKDFVDAHPDAPIKGFNPYRSFNSNWPATQTGDHEWGKKVFALVTSDQSLFSICLWKQVEGDGVYRIADVKPGILLSRTELLNGP
jgi:hypothetical protein